VACHCRRSQAPGPGQVALITPEQLAQRGRRACRRRAEDPHRPQTGEQRRQGPSRRDSSLSAIPTTAKKLIDPGRGQLIHPDTHLRHPAAQLTHQHHVRHDRVRREANCTAATAPSSSASSWPPSTRPCPPGWMCTWSATYVGPVIMPRGGARVGEGPGRGGGRAGAVGIITAG
jgi:hypothetical protein